MSTRQVGDLKSAYRSDNVYQLLFENADEEAPDFFNALDLLTVIALRRLPTTSEHQLASVTCDVR